MTNEEYIRRELLKARPENDEDIVRMKMRAESGGESRWVRVPRHVQDLLTAVAALTPHEAAVLTSLIRGSRPTSAASVSARDHIHVMVLGLDWI